MVRADITCAAWMLDGAHYFAWCQHLWTGVRNADTPESIFDTLSWLSGEVYAQRHTDQAKAPPSDPPR